jgi:hypothetical protein
MNVRGEVVLPLYGQKGEPRGALLDDGTSLRVPPYAAAELSAYLARGAHVEAWETARRRSTAGLSTCTRSPN